LFKGKIGDIAIGTVLAKDLFMDSANALVAIWSSTLELESAVRQLEVSGFDMGRLSIAGKDQRPYQRVIAYYQSGNHIRYWGAPNTFFNEIWAILSGWAFFFLPNIGPVLVAGPLAHWIVTALDNAAIFGDMSAVGMGLYTVGIPRESILQCESALAAGKQLLLVHGSAHEVSLAREFIRELGSPVLP
jgi:hypothetical protein